MEPNGNQRIRMFNASCIGLNLYDSENGTYVGTIQAWDGPWLLFISDNVEGLINMTDVKIMARSENKLVISFLNLFGRLEVSKCSR